MRTMPRCVCALVMACFVATCASARGREFELVKGGRPTPNIHETEWSWPRNGHPEKILLEIRYRIRGGPAHPFEHTYGVLEILDRDSRNWKTLCPLKATRSRTGVVDMTIRASHEYFRRGRIKIRARSGHRSDLSIDYDDTKIIGSE